MKLKLLFHWMKTVPINWTILRALILCTLLFSTGFGNGQPVIKAQAPATPTPLPSILPTQIPSPAPEQPVLSTIHWPSAEEALLTTSSSPAQGTDRGQIIANASGDILNVPPYLWHHGCGPTVAGMIFGYWDKHGFDKLFPGDPITQTDAVNEAIASIDHYNDYSIPLDDLANSPILLPDKSEDPQGDEHKDNSIADFMKTSQSKQGLRYGWTSTRTTTEGFTNYIKSVAPEYSYLARLITMEDELNWDVLRGEVTSGHPMLLIVDTNGDGETDHAGTVIGYNDDTSQMYGIYDTWDTNVHWYPFIKMQSGQKWGVYGAIIFNIGYTFSVNSTVDKPDANPGDGKCETSTPGECTLRAAVQEANTGSGYDTIILPAGVYTLTLNEKLEILQGISISGAGKGKTIIDGNNLNVVLSFGVLPTGTLETKPETNAISNPYRYASINGVTIRNGKGGINAYGFNNLVLTNSEVTNNAGPGIWAYANPLTINNSIISNNTYPGFTGGISSQLNFLTLNYTTVSNNSGATGGIYADNGFYVNGSTISGNTGTGGTGGLELAGAGTILNSTVSGNTGLGISVNDETKIINTTITGNNGGVFFKGNSSVTLQASIIANNIGSNLSAVSGTKFTSNGYNLLSDAQSTVFTPATGDKMGTDPKLGILKDNGGPTFTHELLFTSPAIDGGNPSGCTDNTNSILVLDQRLMTRPVDGSGDSIAVCDIGSFEVQAPITPTPTSLTPTATMTFTPSATPVTITPSVTPSVTPSLTPSVTPSLTPSDTPSLTPSATPVTITPSATPITMTQTVTPTKTPTNTPLPGCYEAIVNGDFEKDEGWTLPATRHTAGYDANLAKAASADYSTDEVHSGKRSMRTGILNPNRNIYSYSSAWQQVSIPSTASSAMLNFWLFPQSVNGIDNYDVQLMILLNNSKLELERPVNMRSNERIWKSYQFDMRKYAGQTVWVYFGTYNNGLSSTMGMYVDDVSLRICATSTSIPNPTLIPITLIPLTLLPQ
ncbi:MAG: choice-of-anchor Q domain-containing protein [Chloroflexota bacterium]